MRRSQLAALPFVWWVLSTAAWFVYVATEIASFPWGERRPMQAISIDFDLVGLAEAGLWLGLGLAFFVLWRAVRRRERATK
jgi:hypothetical protein